MIVNKLFSFGENRLISGLDSMRPIDDWLGRPHRSFRSIHVAGTNGKGSVSLKIAAALSAAGFRTGLYSSPHLETFRERISIDGEAVEEEFIERFFPELFSFVDTLVVRPSFFTLLTAAAFAYFREKEVDYAVIETGLGGRLDATNVITPDLSVITSISRDHCEVLGSSLEEIAFEKAGIIKNEIPVVVGPRALYDPILNAKQILFAPRREGFYDWENQSIAATALRRLDIPEEAVEAGIALRPSCRFEVVSPEPIIFDAAHNPEGFARLAEALELFYPGKRVHLVVAMGKTKAPLECMEQILDKTERVSTISNGDERLFSAEELQAILARGGIEADLYRGLPKGEPLVFCGSFYVMGARSREMRGLLGGSTPESGWSAIASNRVGQPRREPQPVRELLLHAPDSR